MNAQEYERNGPIYQDPLITYFIYLGHDNPGAWMLYLLVAIFNFIMKILYGKGWAIKNGLSIPHMVFTVCCFYNSSLIYIYKAPIPMKLTFCIMQ